ncbi:MAG TPA: putative peptide maturation dehydrogenase, partial [Rudaea sp.]
MRVRRCATLLLEPREQTDFDLSTLLHGGTGVQQSIEWIALAPHLDSEVPVSAAEVAVLGTALPHRWIDVEQLRAAHSRELIDGLIEKGLLIAETGDTSDVRRRDQTLRDMHWRGLDAVAHRFSRWEDVDTIEAQRRFGEETDQTFLERLGPAPPPINERAARDRRLALARPQSSPLDELLAQ